MYVFPIVVCPFVLFLLAIMLSVLRYTVSDCPFGIFKLFLWTTENRVRSKVLFISLLSFKGQGLTRRVVHGTISLVSQQIL
jgi:hypothetical protein